jgi:hypothetical protein
VNLFLRCGLYCTVWEDTRGFMGLIHLEVTSCFKTTLQRKSHLCIPFLGIAQGQSQFLYLCVCERFILYIPRIGPHISCRRIGRSIVRIYKPLTDIFLKIFVSNFRYWFFAMQCITDRLPSDKITRLYHVGIDILFQDFGLYFSVFI